MAGSLDDDVEFMRRKLAETRRLAEDMPLAVEYDNGGGQSGVRENPVFTAYERMLASYIAATKGIDTDAKPEPTRNTLTLIQGKRAKKASNG